MVQPHGRAAELRGLPAWRFLNVRTGLLTDTSVAPLMCQPEGDTSVDVLLRWLEGGHAKSLLLEHGALLFRGFVVPDAAAFERVARAVDPALKKDYLGTSPRDALTEFVFTASELPGHYPIPQHCEMSFVKAPPRRLFFCCLRPNEGPGGETPLADYRKVYQDMDPVVRSRWETRGLRIVRNYSGPPAEGAVQVRDPTQLKRWDQMFGSTDRAVVERKCVENGFEAVWRENGLLRLVSTQTAARNHPETGVPVWFNHANVFHSSAPAGEYAKIAGRLGFWPWTGWRVAAAALTVFGRLTRDPENAPMHVTFADGGTIPDSDVTAVREAIWKNMVFPRWQLGDVVAIDNASVAHGRMPYSGPRRIAVCWA